MNIKEIEKYTDAARTINNTIRMLTDEDTAGQAIKCHAHLKVLTEEILELVKIKFSKVVDENEVS